MKLRKGLSLILVICMMVSLLPQFAAADDTGITMVYDFADGIQGYYDTTPFADMTYAASHQMWAYYANSRGQVHGASKNDSGIWQNIRNRDTGMQLNKSSFTMKIKVYKDGYYIPKQYFGGITGAGTIDVYMLKAEKNLTADEISAARNADNFIGTLNCNIDSSYHMIAEAPEIFDEVKLDRGEYYVIYNANGYDSLFGNLILDGGEGSLVTEIAFDAGLPSVVFKDETVELKVNACFTDATEKNLGNAEVIYDSSNKSVAKIDSNGVLTALSAGTTEVTASAGEGFAKMSITVKELTPSGYTMAYKYSDGIQGYYDTTPFVKMDYASSHQMWSYYANSRGQTHGARKNGENDTGTYQNIRNRDWGMQLNSSSFTMKIKVYKDGFYIPHQYYGGQTGSGKIDVYMLPAEKELTATEITAARIPGNLIGTLNCDTGAAAHSMAEDPEIFDAIELSAGEYYVIYSTSGYDAIFGDLILDGGEGAIATEIGLEIASTRLLEGEKTTLSTVAYMTDGEGKELSPSEVTYSVSDLSVAKIENGVLTALSAAEGLEITVSYGDDLSDRKSIMIDAFVAANTELTYDFDSHLNGYYDMTPLVDYTYEKTGNWAYVDNSAGQTHAAGRVNQYEGDTQNIRNRDWGMDVNSHWIAFKVKIPTRGVYAPKQVYATRSPHGGIMTMYMIPADDTELSGDALEAMFTDDYKIGEVNCLGGTDAYTLQPVPASLESRLFEVGEYYLVYDCVGYCAFSNLTLDGYDGLKTLDVKCETELDVGTTSEIEVSGKLLDKTVVPEDDLEITYSSSAPYILAAEGDEIRGISEGNAVLTVSAEYNGQTTQSSVAVTVTDNSGVDYPWIDAPETLYLRDSTDLSMLARMKSGNDMEIENAEISISACEPEGAAILSDGKLSANAEGMVTLHAVGTFKGDNYEAECTVSLEKGATKTGRSIYTEEMIANARENAEKYDWARAEVKAAVKKADEILEDFDVYYSLIIGEGIPKTGQTFGKNNTDMDVCRYCGKSVTKSGGWKVDVTNRPWKVQCTQCKRIFPSNSFEDFVKLGIDENGDFSRAQALEVHREMLIAKGISLPDGVVSDERKAEIRNGAFITREEQDYYGYGVKGGYLYNDLYQDVGNEATVNSGKGLYETERVETWGVDDGFGYTTGIINDCDTPDNLVDDIYDRHCYIARYNYNVWLELTCIPRDLGYAYMYTNDKKYGRAGAVLLDRIADVYTRFDIHEYEHLYRMVAANTGFGNLFGYLNDGVYASTLAQAADMFFPLLYENDPELIAELSATAQEWNLENKKQSGMDIWKNWEDNILLEIFKEMKVHKIGGNNGRYQMCLAYTALALDREPESDMMWEWLAQSGGYTSNSITGGDIFTTIINKVDRDGHGQESGPGYNSMWFDNYMTVAKLAARYGKDEYDLYKIPKFLKMLASFAELTVAEQGTVQIGDSSATGSNQFSGADETLVDAFEHIKDTPLGPEFADYFKVRFGSKLEDVHYDIFTKNPESLAEDVEEYLESVEYERKSALVAGYGFAILRDGKNFTKTNGGNTLRDFWMYFGGATSHKHADALNLGIEAYGMNFSPDLGYPTDSTYNSKRFHWESATISHNTVTVNGRKQINAASEKSKYPGKVHHFDNSDKVKLMDLSQPSIYDACSEYRRSVVMIEINDDVSYGVDFFRVTGGDSHVFSFHPHSAEDAVVESGLSEPVAQVDENGNYVGTLVGMGEDGKGAPYTITVDDGNGGTREETRYFVGPGADPRYTEGESHENLEFPTGYTFLERVRRSTPTSNQFAVDFDITDYRKTIKDNKDLGLKLTMLNDFTFDEVAFAKGPVPNKSTNKLMPSHLEYMIATRKGENLDSLFTTVYEPYKGDNYIEKIEAITPEILAGELDATDMVKAVKVTHKSGNRVDYIIYSTNESVTYRLEGDDDMTFRGFVGVWTKNVGADKVIYSYRHGGEDTLTGNVKGFTEELSLKNYIDVSLSADVDLNTLAGKQIIINHDGIGNAAYTISSATDEGDGLADGDVRLDIGTVTPIRSYIDNNDFDKGYIYNIGKGQSFVIPMTNEKNFSPDFPPVSDSTTSAGSKLEIAVSATGYDGAGVTIEGRELPRGASFDSNTNTFSWKPDDSQVGDNHVSLVATDEFGRESVVHFTVTVYGATTGNKNEVTETPSTEGSGASGGGGGGGGGAEPTPDKPEDIGNTDEDRNEDTGDNAETGSDVAPDASGETDAIRFTDLGNYEWATDAINALADDGIIKGTSENAFSPASNITRADFALLLVRAFDLKSDNSENFDDVSASDYFAPELAIARNTGIVNGIGDNNYAPRNTITRQDMMVIVYRALTTLNVGFGENIEPQFEDFDAVADYAKEAVSALISAGLVNGKNNLIAPGDFTTRAEVAVLIKRILDYLK